MSTTWHVAHRSPGRIRFRLGGLRQQPALCRRLYRMGESADGIRGIEVNPVTGSVIVRYDASVRDAEKKIEAALRESIGARGSPHEAHHARPKPRVTTIERTANEEARLVSSALDEASEVEVATQVIEADAKKLAKRSSLIAHMVSALKRLNAKVKRATRGVLDLQLALVLPFAVHSLLFRKKDAFFWSVLGLFSLHAVINLSTPSGAGA